MAGLQEWEVDFLQGIGGQHVLQPQQARLVARRCAGCPHVHTPAMDPALEQATGGGAPQPAENPADARRIALDGQAYTWPCWDDAERCWYDAYDRGAPQLAVHAHGEPQPPAAIDEGTPPGDAIQHQQNDSDASQLAVNAYGEPQPTAAIDEGTPHEDDA